MKPALYAAAGLLVAGCVLAAGPKGSVPRQSASSYPASGEVNGTAVGARVLTPAQVKDTFATELNRCCVVVEFAVYPAAGKPVEVSWNDFALRLAIQQAGVKPGSAPVLAATIQKSAASQRDITIYPSAGVGYESGTVYDPATGQPRRQGGVTTSVGVGVGVGGSQPAPGSSERDRKTMEQELSEKGLPEGQASAPVAGYLYFPMNWKKNAQYQLQYTLEGHSVTLRLH